jgi:peroxiredoxin
VGVCHDSPQSLRTLALRDSLPFELLSDSTGEVAAVYGAFDFSISSILPGYILVDRRGKVRMVLLGQELAPEQLVDLTRYALGGP